MILSWKYTADRTRTFLTGGRVPNIPFLRRNQDRDVVKQSQGFSMASSRTGLRGPMEDRWAVAGSRTEVENKTNGKLAVPHPVTGKHRRFCNSDTPHG